jgi:hypothetical protein
MTTVRYKGFTILARPYQLHQSTRWSVDLEIRREGQRQTFGVDERFRTEQEADARCAGLGRRIIDGEIPRCSVDHLREASGSWAPQRAWKKALIGPCVFGGLVIIGLGAYAFLE